VPAAAPGEKAAAGSDRVAPVGSAGRTTQVSAVALEHPPLLSGRRARRAAEITDVSCAPLEGLDRNALGVTYWFEAPAEGDRRSVSVRLRGRLLEREGEGDVGGTTFDVVTTVHDVLPGSGWQCITTRVTDVAPGRWDVTATPVAGDAVTKNAPRSTLPPGLARAATSGRTGFGMVIDALAPGVWPGSWPALVGLGFLLGLVVQALLATRLGLSWAPLTGTTVVAGALGLLGAKGYFLLTHPEERKRSLKAPGMSVQGFVIIAFLVLVVWTLGRRADLGAVLDATAPGLFVGMAVGRLGCLFAGCCVGRPTASRWGLWSSDREVGTRRIPVQLMESSTAAVLAVVTAVAVLTSSAAGTGVVLAVGFAAYLIGRQLLFPLRAVGRVTTYGRVATLVVASIVLVVGLVLMALRG
jgi:phosphatidylglycerol:prolipoprotein diacylglycerol transferase